MSHNGHPDAPRIPRDIEDSEEFTELAAKIQPHREVLDEWLNGLLFVVATIPEEFDGVGNVRVAFHEGSVVLGIPGLMVTFRYTDTLVTLLWIEVVERDSPSP